MARTGRRWLMFTWLDFVITRFLMKLFHNNMDIIPNCQQYFAVELPSNVWVKHVDRFEEKFAESSNSFCNVTAHVC